MMAVKTYFEEDVKKDIMDALKIEIEEAPDEKLGDIMLKIILRGRSIGLEDKDMEELKVVFRKRLKEVV
jgi:hypothetical protein